MVKIDSSWHRVADVGEMALTQIFRDMPQEHSRRCQVIDIGSGLKLDCNRGNRASDKNAWLKPYLKNVDYLVLDYVSTYKPDILGDIQDLPLADNSVDAIICLSILEHVENPIKAAAEIYRVLQPGGRCYVHVPFLFYYHAEKGYYGDYWRFTLDTLQLLFKGFSTVYYQQSRGAIESWFHLLPIGRKKIFKIIGRSLDRIFKKQFSPQTSSYSLLIIK